MIWILHTAHGPFVLFFVFWNSLKNLMVFFLAKIQLTGPYLLELGHILELEPHQK